jgi:protein-disulfide isomerase
MKRYLPFVIIAVVLVASIGAGFFMFRSTRSESTNPLGASPVAPPDVAKSSRDSTTPKGVVTIEEFGDYQCPPCGLLHPVLKTLKGEYGNRIELVFHHLPLTQLHKHALEAAYAAEAAKFQGKFWEMHNLLYESQSAWTDVGDFRPVAINYARQIGLDTARFQRDMDGLEVLTRVTADEQRANNLGVNSTPTVFLNGQLIQNDNFTVEGMRKEINQRLNANP